jgi:co-chaperonin GroES (HSP10)
VQRVKAEAKTASGIFLPESSVKELNEAKVLAVGPGIFTKDGKRVPMGVSAGDRVLIPQVCGTRILLRLWLLDADVGTAVRRLARQGWRGGVPPFPGQRVSFAMVHLY